MKLFPESYTKYDHFPSRESQKALQKTQFKNTLSKEKQVLEIGCGTGYFAQKFLLPSCQPCRRLVVTDVQPEMVDFRRQNFSHSDIVHDVLDIASPNLDTFLDKYGKFDRIFSFLSFHMIHPINVAYANVAKLLNEGGECLITAFSSFDIADVWAEVCETDAWRGRIPVSTTDSYPRTIANETFNFNCIKPAAQVEAEVRNRLRGTGLKCISCEVYDSTWKYDDIDSLLDMFLTLLPFKPVIPNEEWSDFRSLWADLTTRKLAPVPGQPLEVKLTVSAIHGCRSE
ncbi:juvenile hormone acid O-methyltransferase-like [Haemaphysalis longicornis]